MTKTIIYITVLLSVFVLHLTNANAQDGGTQELATILKNTVNIQSPNTASLGQYGEIPVSTYTGVPDISIPLYEIKNGDISIPIVLSYHASGIRVNQEASWVGLGWDIQVGGMISLEIRDEYDNFGVKCFPDRDVSEIDDNYTVKEGDAQPYCQGEVFDPIGINGDFDGEPDMYSYNFLGNSGKFFYNRDGVFTSIRQSNIKFTQSNPYNFGIQNPDYSWTAITDNGTVCFFDALEKTEANVENSLPSISRTMYLSKIVSTKGRNIDFSYIKGPQVELLPSHSESCSFQSNYGCPFSGTNNPEKKSETVKSEPLYLNEINFEVGKVKFITSDDRIDLDGKKLIAIEIYKGTETIPFKTIVFHYDNFTGNPIYGDYLYHPLNTNYSTVKTSNRLKLTSIDLKGTGAVDQTYSFGYDETHQLPYKTSYACDYWNYFNGKVNTSLIPDFNKFSRFCYQIGGVDLASFEIGKNNNREPDPNYATTATLTKITYPTGGSTNYLYESNKYQNINWLNREEHSEFVSTGGYVSEKDIYIDPISGENVYLTYVFECGSLSTCYESDSHYLLVKGLDTGNSYISIRINSNQGKNGQITRTLPKGNYKITAVKPAGNDYGAYLKMKWYEKSVEKEAIGPGLRIKEIVTKDADGITVTNRKVYNYNDENGVTTGKLMSIPVFARYSERLYNLLNGIILLRRNINFFSSSIIPLSYSASGQPLGYSVVTESNGANGEGGIVTYSFHNNADDMVSYVSILPGTPLTYDIANGNLLMKTYYETKNQTQNKIKCELYHYTTVTKKEYGVIYEYTGSRLSGDDYYLHYYPIIYGTNLLSLKEEHLIFDGGEIANNEVYSYNANNQISKILNTTSDGKEILTTYKYPNDFVFETCYNQKKSNEILNDNLKEQCMLAYLTSTYYNCMNACRSTYLPPYDHTSECNKFMDYLLEHPNCPKSGSSIYTWLEDKCEKSNIPSTANKKLYDICVLGCGPAPQGQLDLCLRGVINIADVYQTCIDNISNVTEDVKVLKDMVETNNISPVIEELKYLIDNNDFYLLNGKFNKYKRYSNIAGHSFFMPESISIIENKSPILSDNFQEVSFSLNSSGIYELIHDSRYKFFLQAANYDTYGNPTSMQTKDGLTTTYTWGYNGQYPLTKTIKKTGSIDSPEIKESWTWEPLIGMKSHTDPTGLTTTYDYDDFNRLQTVKLMGKILQYTEYHYKQ